MHPYGPALIENFLAVHIKIGPGGLLRASRRCTHLQAGSVLLLKGICACLQEERLPLQHAMPLIEHLHCQSCYAFQPLPDGYTGVLDRMREISTKLHDALLPCRVHCRSRLPVGRLCCPQT